MSVIESIVRDLQGVPVRKLVEVARQEHRSSKTTRQERVVILHETHGCLDETDGAVFVAALADSRRIDAHG